MFYLLTVVVLWQGEICEAKWTTPLRLFVVDSVANLMSISFECYILRGKGKQYELMYILVFSCRQYNSCKEFLLKNMTRLLKTPTERSVNILDLKFNPNNQLFLVENQCFCDEKSHSTFGHI
jgi:hypothetical protein